METGDRSQQHDGVPFLPAWMTDGTLTTEEAIEHIVASAQYESLVTGVAPSEILKEAARQAGMHTANQFASERTQRILTEEMNRQILEASRPF